LEFLCDGQNLTQKGTKFKFLLPIKRKHDSSYQIIQKPFEISTKKISVMRKMTKYLTDGGVIAYPEVKKLKFKKTFVVAQHEKKNFNVKFYLDETVTGQRSKIFKPIFSIRRLEKSDYVDLKGQIFQVSNYKKKSAKIKMIINEFDANCHAGKYSLSYWDGKKFQETFFNFKLKPKTQSQEKLCMKSCKPGSSKNCEGRMNVLEKFCNSCQKF